MFNEITMFMTEATHAYDIENRKIQAVSNANYREYDLNKAKIELKIMQENGTVDDYIYLMTEAEEGFISKAGAVLTKIKEAFIKFITAIKEGIKDVIDKITGKKVLPEIERKLKTNPGINKKKIMVPDIDAQNKVYNETMSKLEVAASKVASGQDISKEDVERIMTTHRKKKAAVIGIAAATAVTAGAAVALAKSTQDKAYEDLNVIQKKFVDVHDTIARAFSNLKGKFDKSKDDNAEIILGEMRTRQEVGEAVASAAAAVGEDHSTTLLDNIKAIPGILKSFFTNLKTVEDPASYATSTTEACKEGEDAYVDPAFFPEPPVEVDVDVDEPVDAFGAYDDPADIGDDGNGDGIDAVVSIDGDDEDVECGESTEEATTEEEDDIFESAYNDLTNPDNRESKPTTADILSRVYRGSDADPVSGESVSPKYREILDRLNSL